MGLLAPVARPADPDPEVVKAVRAVLDTKKEEERDELKAALLKRPDLDWAALKKGCEEGPFFQKPLITAYGMRGSSKHFDLVWSGEDGTPRGFLLWVPKTYEAQPTPLILYLHDSPQVPHVGQGGSRAEAAVSRFRDMCEEQGMFFVAPYTSRGAEWWTPQGRKLVEWTLRKVRQHYNIDDDRIGLLGSLGGGDSVWYLGQEMPGTWSVLMPMTGDPYEITAIIRPLFLATLDRMDILVGVPGKTSSTVGEKDANRFLADLKPMFGQRMRITTSVWPTAQSDFSYLEGIAGQIGAFVKEHKRKPYADEVDVEVEAGDGLRSLWLRNDGYDPDGDKAPGHFGFKSTLLKWSAPARKDPDKKLGVGLQKRDGVPGLVINATPGEAKNAQIFPGDVLLEIDGQPVDKIEDVKAAIDKHDWNEEAHLLIARDIRESDLGRHERREERYRRYREKIAALRAEGKPIPAHLWDETAVEEEDEPEDEGCGEEDEGGIVISGDDEEAGPEEKKKPRAHKEVKKVVKLVERWVKIRRPGGVFVRQDFGASYDPTFDKEGLKITGIYAGSLADRSGFKDGDVLVQIGDTQVKNIHDVEDFFATVDDGKPFRFEDEPEGGNSIDFTIRRPTKEGHYEADRQITVRWEKVKSSRVDARWDKRENTLYVLANNASGFTLYFTDDLIEPGKEFHLFINNVPYQDLVDPAGVPDYPKAHDNPAAADELYRMRRKRAKVEGWQPDLAWALDEFLQHWDRRQVYGAKRTFDLTAMKEGFAKARERTKREDDFPERVTQAYEEHRARTKG